MTTRIQAALVSPREWTIEDIREHHSTVQAIESRGWTRCEARFEARRWREPYAMAAARVARRVRRDDVADARRTLCGLDYWAPGVVADQDGMLTVQHDAGQEPEDALATSMAAHARTRELVAAALRLRAAQEAGREAQDR